MQPFGIVISFAKPIAISDVPEREQINVLLSRINFLNYGLVSSY